MKSDLIEPLLELWAAQDDSQPSALAWAPGRVELLGNHTDYNGGLVMAAAIDRGTLVLGRRRPEPTATVASVRYRDVDRFSTDGTPIEPGPAGDWRRYVRAVAWMAGPLRTGFEAVILGTLPIGAGLSSSASLQAAVAVLLARLGLADLPGAVEPSSFSDADRMELAHRLRRAENEFVGVASGLLDQFSVLFGKADHALILDCRTLEHDRVRLGDPAPAIVVCDTKTSRKLADGMYNLRRAECERVVDFYRSKRGPGVVNLRDVTLEDLEADWDQLDPLGRRRARHVLSENVRVEAARRLLREGDLPGFGRLMSDSHASSRDDFENSSVALNAMIEAAEASPGFLGGKLSGAGWAGCTVNLVQADQTLAFAESVRAHYRASQGVTPEIHICRSSDGAMSRGG